MDFALTDAQQQIRDAVQRLCARFDDAYWLERDRVGDFPDEFHQAMAEGGWLGIAMPEEYRRRRARHHRSGGGDAGGGAVGRRDVRRLGGPHEHFRAQPGRRVRQREQKRRFLPPLIAGREKACFAVTEPDVGLDTTRIKTRAVRDGNGYVINGRKIWTSTAQVTEKMLILTRTTPYEEAARPSAGMTLFYTDLDRPRSRCARSPRWAAWRSNSNMLFIDGLKVPLEDRIGEEGKGFHYILHGMNPERILIAAEAVGLGRAALARAAHYAKERVVFGRPIGQNQGIQHPLAERWIDLEAAELLV